jgi:glutamyl-tRNA reductase
VGELANITLLNSDDFGHTTHTTAQAQADLKHQVNTLVCEDWQAFRAWHTSLPAQQALAHVRSHFEAMRQQELANLGPDTEEWLPAMDEFSRGLMNKWLHTPISNLRQSSFNSQDIETITRAMHLLFDVPVVRPTEAPPAVVTPPPTPEVNNVVPLSKHPRATHG